MKLHENHINHFRFFYGLKDRPGTEKITAAFFKKIFCCLKFRDLLGGKNFVTINKPVH